MEYTASIYTENWCSAVLRNVGIHLPDYTASQPRRRQYKYERVVEEMEFEIMHFGQV